LGDKKIGERNTFEKTPHFHTVKGFYSHFRHFAFAATREGGSRRRRSREETTFINELLEIFQIFLSPTCFNINYTIKILTATYFFNQLLKKT